MLEHTSMRMNKFPQSQELRRCKTATRKFNKTASSKINKATPNKISKTATKSSSFLGNQCICPVSRVLPRTGRFEESPANTEMSGVSMPARIKSICEFQPHTIYKHIYIHMYTNMYIHIMFVLCSFNISDLDAVNTRKVPRTLWQTRQVSLHCTILLRTISELT